ncbi:cation:proton antiporter, partial [Acidianus sp. RZ1]|uniref:cation:proton antiporter domain-containing protein n=1 Tax=Acidianus sp. RZ1 TaxID=1540082 RepID=UPI001492F3F0
RIDEESIAIILPISLVFIFEYISQIVDVPSTLTMILAGLAFSSVSNSERVMRITAPVREFALIFFFLAVGSLVPISLDLLTFLEFSFIIILIKYFAFSLSSWLTGSNFVKSFTNGIYMIPISEFGIIVSLDAISQGINVFPIYLTSITVVILSSIVASILIIKVDYISETISKVYERFVVLQQMDSAIAWLYRSAIKDISPIASNN